MEPLTEVGRRLRWDAPIYERVRRHPRTPLPARVLLAAVMAYLALPLEGLPAMFPGPGELDEYVFLPLLALIALALTPRDVVLECR